MEHGVGYFIKLENEATLYLMGDTILTNEIREFIKKNQPDYIVAPTGKAQFDIGAPLLLTATVQGDFGFWNILDWTALPLEPNQAIKFRIRTASSEANLALAEWYGPSGSVLDPNDWTTNYFGQVYGESPIENLFSINSNQFAQIQVKLEHNG
ncbi:hypothetical protein LCGC14_2962210, partial [marine sediment metagenome]